MENIQQKLNDSVEKLKKEDWESVLSTVDSNKESAKLAIDKLVNSSVGDEIGYYFLLKSEVWNKGEDGALGVFYDELKKVVSELKSEGSYIEIAILRFLQEQGIEYDRNKITETINSVAERKDNDFINASSEYARLISFAIKNNIPFNYDAVKTFIGKRMSSYLEDLRGTGLLDPEIVEQYDSGKKKIVLG
jgi:hypothetical protein